MNWSNANLESNLVVEAPALVLGGDANALSVARSLGRSGVPVYTTFGDSHAAHSRYIRENLDMRSYSQDYALLLRDKAAELAGAAVFACSDDAVEAVATHRARFAGIYEFERNRPELQLAMLNKQRTLELARDLDVPIPRFWCVDESTDLEELGATLPYPVIVKPFDTFAFRKVFKRSYLRADNKHELLGLVAQARFNEMDFMICELIPGADDCACSAYTYMDETGEELFSLTKRCLRRIPNNVGAGTFQITTDLEDVREMAQRFFRGLGWRGFGNLEFKRDPRDGSLRVIECNARFTAVHEQLAAAGNDLSLLSYRHMTGQEIAPLRRNRQRVAIWSPRVDFHAFREHRARTGAPFSSWLRSLAAAKLVFPVFSLRDPEPAFRATVARVRELAGKLRARVRCSPSAQQEV